MPLHPDKLHGVNMALAPKSYGSSPGLISRIAGSGLVESRRLRDGGGGSKKPRKRRRYMEKPHDRNRYDKHPGAMDTQRLA